MCWISWSNDREIRMALQTVRWISKVRYEPRSYAGFNTDARHLPERIVAITRDRHRMTDDLNRGSATCPGNDRRWAALQTWRRAENSHQPTRLRERVMRRFKSAGHAQRFLSAFGIITSHFRVGRHQYRDSRLSGSHEVEIRSMARGNLRRGGRQLIS